MKVTGDSKGKNFLGFSRKTILVTFLLMGFVFSMFDLLRKTVFVNAAWNYNYPFWNFVYNIPILIVLVLLLFMIVFLLDRFLDLSTRRFAIALYLVMITIFTLSLLAFPVKFIKVIDVDKRGLYGAALFFIENGPVSYFASFHSLPTSTPQNPDLYIHDPATDSSALEPLKNEIKAYLRSLGFLPWNDDLAAYITKINTQRHGPISPLLIVPFLILFGYSTTSAAIGNVLLLALLPVIAYAAFRLHFCERISRVGAILMGITPALFIFMRSASPVPYDAFTTLFVAVSFYLFLRGISENSLLLIGATGVVLSFAALTKISGLLVVLPYLLILIVTKNGFKEISAYLGSLGISLLALPLLLIPVGYNFIAQYVFTVYKLAIYSPDSNGGLTRPASAAALESDLIGVLGTLYNIRWMNLVLLLLIGLFVIKLMLDYSLLRDNRRDLIGTIFLLPAIPFAFLPFLMSGTLSRHALVLLVPLGFSALCGYSMIVDKTDVDIARFGTVLVLISAVSFIINL